MIIKNCFYRIYQSILLKVMHIVRYNHNVISGNGAVCRIPDIFQNYPNLEELYLAENTLSDVTFAKELKHLKVFDITDNYVTDLSPLSELAELKSILCARNAVVNDGGLRTDIILKN